MTENPFQLPGYQVIGMQDTGVAFDVHLQPPSPVACSSCGTIGDFVKNGTRDIRVMDLPVHGKPVTLWIARQRFQCKSCGSTFRPELPGIHPDAKMTERLHQYIEREAFNGTHKALAERVGVDEKTVRTIFSQRLVALNQDYKPEMPTIIGVDELFLNRKYRGIITNIGQQTIVDVLENRNKPTIEKFLKDHDTKNIEIASMDMWGPYRQAFHEVLPDVLIVVDKFHVTRMANDALEKLRKGLHKSLTSTERRQLKGDRKILLKRENTLSDTEILTSTGWLNNFPQLLDAYKTKERFFDIWDLANDPYEAKQMLEAWRSSIPEKQLDIWADLVKASRNWEDEILNYFATGKEVTNALTESLNRKIRDKNRDGRGYSFDVLRGKILFSTPHKTRQVTNRSSPFKSNTTKFMKNFSFSDLLQRTELEEDIIIDYGVDLSTI